MHSIRLRRTSLLLAAVAIIGLLPSSTAAAAGAFWDDDANVHEWSIEGLAEANVTVGCDPPARSRFCPDDDISRGQMAALLARALDLPETSEDYFTDDEESIFEADINRIAAAGITQGCNPPENTEFCSEDSVTREQMAAFLQRAYDVPNNSEDAFADDEDSIFEGNIDAIASVGITRGCNPPQNTRFCPDDPVRRDQIATFLVRADHELDARDPGRLHERTVTYEVRAYDADADPTLVPLLRRRAEEALYATDGWNIRHRLLIEHVDTDGDFTLYLASGDAIGAEPGCSDDYSCTVGDDVLINQGNLVQRPEPWASRRQTDYQRYLVLHEVGHWLDFDNTDDRDDPSHYNDETYCVDAVAPVMKQQSITTGDCTTNIYPLPFERDCVEEAWLDDTTDQGDGDGDLDDQCPHQPAGR